MNDQTNEQIDLGVKEVVVAVLIEQIEQMDEQPLAIEDLIDSITGEIIRNRVDQLGKEFN